MYSKKNELRTITQKAMSKLAQEEIVFPSKYLQTFMDEQQHMEEKKEKISEYEEEIQTLKRMEYRLLGTNPDDQILIDGLVSDVHSLRSQLFSDDLTRAKNRLWLFKQKLQEDGTFSDSGVIVISKFTDHASMVKEYGSNISDTLIKQISEYMIRYMEEHHIVHEIVRYTDDSFLIFISTTEDERTEEAMLNLHQGMEGRTFKHKNRIFKLKFLFAVMQYVRNEPFSLVLDRLDERLFEKNL